MHGYVEHRRVIVEHTLRAVAMVNVPDVMTSTYMK